jgi:tRNA/rRNA methyltransferase
MSLRMNLDNIAVVLHRPRYPENIAATDLVEAIEVFEDLETALAPFQYMVGTTARLGSRRPAVPKLR